MYRVLIVDDEKEIRNLLRLYLEKDDISIVEAENGIVARRLFNEYKIDMALIDIMMPQINGYELLKEIRSKNNIPVIIISAKIQPSDKILGLELGADDYITKPFDALEVAARVKAGLRRFYKLGSGNSNEDVVIKVRNLTLNLHECVLYIDSEKIELSSVEFRILELLMGQPGRIFTKEQIYETGWLEQVADDNSIRVAISKLRDKVGKENIKTIRGLGYRLEKTL
ncbi:MAG: response regulator transcription factor [Suipraeoptans sp.]